MGARWDVGDPEVDAFVDANMVSFAAWDLVIYLNRNPQAAETLASLSAILARQDHDLMPAVRALVQSGTLVEDRQDEGAARYRLTDDPDRRRVVTRFVALAAKREHRLEFVRRVLSHLTGS